MKLAICSVGELFGGVERHILGMAIWLMREGHDFILILFHDGELGRQAREIGIEPVILETRGPLDIQAVVRLGKILSLHEITVVHAHGYRAVVNCALVKRYHRFRLVRTVHGLVEPTPWLSWRGLKGKLYTRLERFFGRRARASVVYVTEDLRRRHLRHDRGLVTQTIHNGIEPMNRENFSRPSELEHGVTHLAAVGRVTPVKGLEFAIRAMRQIDPDSDAVLNIIGTGPLTGELEALACEVGVAERVRFLGFRKNVFDFLAHIDGLIMPSVHEGLPYSILEAMALGTPALASRVAGLAEILVHEKTALLFDVADVAGIAGAIDRLCGEEGLGKRLGEEARRDQRARYTLDRSGQNYWALYTLPQVNQVVENEIRT